jgi:hypothetical protein
MDDHHFHYITKLRKKTKKTLQQISLNSMITLLFGTINLNTKCQMVLCNCATLVQIICFFNKKKKLIIQWISMNLDICQWKSELQKETYWMP